MWRSFLVAGGIFACIVGVELLLVDSAVLKPLHGGGGSHFFTAPDWMPWTLLSVGAATILHSGGLTGRSSPQMVRHP